ncbi:MAG: hypothetical protein HY526_02160 [Betaproteobacteria bacterium]|nr:hypothetical protein [Betaproteobacteria bacterium]
MNPFLNFDRRFQPPLPPRRLYAQVEKIEPLPATQQFSVRLDGVDANWFDQPLNQSLGDGDFFARAPLAAVELELVEPDAAGILGIAWDDILEGGAGPWLTIELLPPTHGYPAIIYTNVFSPEGSSTAVRTPLAQPPARRSTQLRRRFSLRAPKASLHAIRHALGGATASSDGLVVYDIGQGNCNAAVNSAGQPLLYFDFGSPYNSQMHTWSGLRQFCLCQQPAIVLSHWDLDHFASANIDTRALSRPWIVPRQRLGPTHRAFAQQLKNNNCLLVWPKRSSPGAFGPITILECGGTTINDSGLAVIAEGKDRSGNTHQALLPGDARYTAVPGYNTHTFLSLVSPHHGAQMRSSWTPHCPGLTQSRLVHSFGRGNSFRHPRDITRQRHQASGWNDPRINPPRHPSRVRETADRNGGYGHVFIPWDSATAIPPVNCCGNGSLTPTQT